MPFNKLQLKKEILVSFGHPTIPVELDDDALELCITNTLDIYSKYKPLTGHETIVTPVGGMTGHELPVTVTGIKRVNIVPSITGLGMYGSNIEAAMVSGFPVFFTNGSTVFDMQYYDLRLRWLKTVQRELGLDPDWGFVQDPITGRFTVYTFSSHATSVDVEVYLKHNIDLSTIPHYNQNWFRRYAINEGKKILGQIRGKFNEIPVAGGKTQLNGVQLTEQSANEEQKLIKEIEASRVDLFPIWA